MMLNLPKNMFVSAYLLNKADSQFLSVRVLPHPIVHLRLEIPTVSTTDLEYLVYL